MTLIAIGGAEDKKDEMTVLKRVLAEAKGAQSRVYIITTATSVPEERKKAYEEAFAKLGVAECTVTHVATREEAEDAKIAKDILNSDVVFFTGGDQLMLTMVLGGTAVHKALLELHKRGGVVGGTSAGAAAVSDLMIFGDPIKQQPEPLPDRPLTLSEQFRMKDVPRMTSGLDLTPHLVFDTHFTERKRLSRLQLIVESNPANIGVGVDEDTAVVMKLPHLIEVVGNGTVTVVDKTLAPKVVKAGECCNLVTGAVFPAIYSAGSGNQRPKRGPRASER